MKALFRICKRKYGAAALEAFNGQGAKEFPGRWNSGGMPVVYTCETLSLAILELLVHLDVDMLALSYVYFEATVPVDLIRELPPQALPGDWNADPAPYSTKAVGDLWLREAFSPVYRVPSVMSPVENNYLINPVHPDFKRLSISGPMTISLDSRLK